MLDWIELYTNYFALTSIKESMIWIWDFKNMVLQVMSQKLPIAVNNKTIYIDDLRPKEPGTGMTIFDDTRVLK